MRRPELKTQHDSACYTLVCNGTLNLYCSFYLAGKSDINRFAAFSAVTFSPALLL